MLLAAQRTLPSLSFESGASLVGGRLRSGGGGGLLYHSPGGNRNRHEKRVPPPREEQECPLTSRSPGLEVLSGQREPRRDTAGGRSVGGCFSPGKGGAGEAQGSQGGPGAHVCGSAPQRSPRKRVVWSRGGTPLLLPGLYSVWGPLWVLALWEEPRWL